MAVSFTSAASAPGKVLGSTEGPDRKCLNHEGGEGWALGPGGRRLAGICKHSSFGRAPRPPI